MYTPKNYLMQDKTELLSFMRRYSFAIIITAHQDYPEATHLPFVIEDRNGTIFLLSHFSKANPQWKSINDKPVLVIFAEPHAYISPSHYEKEENVPTWNYISVHAYGKGRILESAEDGFNLLGKTILTYEPEYQKQWAKLPDKFKNKEFKGIVPFEIEITDLQGKQKLSQNKSEYERNSIINTLSDSEASTEQQLAEYMRKVVK